MKKIIILMLVMVLLVQTVLGLEGGDVFSSDEKDYYFWDTFTDTDGTAITSHTAETGQTWGSDAGPSSIQSNTLEYAGGDRAKVSFGDPTTNITCDFYLNQSGSLNNNLQLYLRNGGTETTTLANRDSDIGDLRYLNSADTWVIMDAVPDIVSGDNMTWRMSVRFDTDEVNYTGIILTNESGTLVYTQVVSTGWVVLRNTQTSVDEIWFNPAAIGMVDEIACWNVTDGVFTNRPLAPPPDLTPPVVNTTFNITNIKANNILNISANMSDEIALSTAVISINFSTGLLEINFTISGLSTAIHNITPIPETRGNVLNITVFATDTSSNTKQNSTLFTIVNSIPSTPTILFPTIDDYNNTQPNYPFDVTFPADVDGDPITIYYYINGILNHTALGNTTFNASDGHFILNVSLFDGIGFSPNATVNFTIDTTIPTLLFFNLTNNTIFGFNINASINITIQDTNPFNLTYTVHNSSDVLQSGYNDIANSSTTIMLIPILSLSDLASGNYTIDINFSDRHTTTAISDYSVSILDFGLYFKTKEGSEITITQTIGLLDKKDISYEKQTDRYTIGFGETAKRETKTFLVIADREIKIIRSEYKGHLIIGKNWMDFENKDKGSEVDVVRIEKNIVSVTVYSNDFNFMSIGGLNVVNVFYNFQVDNDPPTYENFAINDTFPSLNAPVNISVDCVDAIGISTCIIGHNNSGSWANATNITIDINSSNVLAHHFVLTVTVSLGGTVGAMACANDTSNEFSCSNILTLQVNDTELPTILTGNNATRFLGNKSINFTYNVTDNFLLSDGQVIITQSGEIQFFNNSLTGTVAEFSQAILITASAGDVINVTGRVNDSFGNLIQTETIFSVTKDFFVNATNVFDNTTIKSYTVTISNATFVQTKTTTSGLLNFTDLIEGIYQVNITSNENGGYHNLSIPSQDVRNDLVGKLHQAVVFFTAVRRGTNVDITDFNVSLTKLTNQSNSTGELRLLVNASTFFVSGKSDDYFDTSVNISLTNQSTSNHVIQFYDLNVSISILSVSNNTFIKDFTVELSGTDGTSFTETLPEGNTAKPGNVTFSLGNGTYDITVMHDEFTTAFFSFTVASDSTYPNLTFTLIGLNALNFSVFDEITELLIPGNATIDLITDISARNFTADNGTLYIQDLEPGEYRITYSAPKYTERDYYIDILNDTNQTIELYLLTITNGTDVTFTVQDNSGQDIENATIRLKRYYLSSNSYRTIAMSRTNTEGKAVIDVDFNDAFYETLTTFKDLSLRTIGAKIITTTLILTMNPTEEPFSNVDAIDNVETSMNFNNLTETFTYTFTDLGGNSREGTLTVIEITPTTETVVCTSTDTSPSATLICQVNTTNATATFSAKGEIKVGSTSIITDALNILTGITRQLKDIWGGQGVFFTILVAGVIGGLGMIVSPAVGIIMFLVSLLVVNFFGMTILSGTIYGFFILVGIFIIWKMKQ